MTDENGNGHAMQSETIGKLAEALSAAQALIKAPKKGKEAKIPTKDGGSYSYHYADLADVIEATREPLCKNGLALVQPMMQRDGHVVLVTKLLHTSGEWIASEFPMQVYAKPQEQGSAITYLRRYLASSLLGIAAEDDDDGKRAQDAEPRKAEPQPISADAAAILTVAAELGQIIGIDADTLVQTASEFQGNDGKSRAFTAKDLEDGKRISDKWLKGVRAKLEKQLQKEGAMAAASTTDIPF